MIVKTKENQISFLFYEPDPFFDMGCGILEQENFAQMLPYKRTQQNGREKLVFKIDGKRIVKLANKIQNFSERDIIDVLYEMIFLVKKVEENGFLKRECIWFQYDSVYYDKNSRDIKVAILPVIKEAQSVDDVSWREHMEKTLSQIIGFLSKEKAAQIQNLFSQFWAGKSTESKILDELERLGCNVSGVLSRQLALQKETILELIYSGRGSRILFAVNNNDFLIGRDVAMADGVIPEELSKAVSRKHCLVSKMQDKYFVQDLESVNRTLVNGIMIPPYEWMELEDNDILSVADIEFRIKKKYIDK